MPKVTDACVNWQPIHLETWVATFPQLKKQLANLFEVWIGSIFHERRVWDENSLERLEEFFGRLWEIRFRVLQLYMHRRWALSWKLSSVEEDKEDVEVICSEVRYPDSPLFEQCRLNFPGVRERSVGFVARATCMPLSPGKQNSIQVFDPEEGRARDLAR